MDLKNFFPIFLIFFLLFFSFGCNKKRDGNNLPPIAETIVVSNSVLKSAEADGKFGAALVTNRNIDLALKAGIEINWSPAQFEWKKFSDNNSEELKLYDDFVELFNSKGMQYMGRISTGSCWDKVKDSPNCNGYVQRPYSMPKNIEDYKVFAKQLFERYKGKIQYYYVLDEVSTTFDGTVEEYVELLNATYDAAKEVDSSIKILPASYQYPFFVVLDLRELFEAGNVAEAKAHYKSFLIETIGARDYSIEKFDELIDSKYVKDEAFRLKYILSNGKFDAFSVHNYSRFVENKNFDSTMQMVSEKIKKYAGEKEIVSLTSIFSYPFENSAMKPSDALAASELVKRFSILFSNGFEKVFWWCVADVPNTADKVNQVCGLIDKQLNEKPIFNAYKLMAEKMKGFKTIERFNILNENVFVYKISFSKKQLFLAWSEAGNVKIDLTKILSQNTVKTTIIPTTSNDSVEQIEKAAQIEINSVPKFIE